MSAHAFAWAAQRTVGHYVSRQVVGFLARHGITGRMTMIDGLVGGRLYGEAQIRTGQNGRLAKALILPLKPSFIAATSKRLGVATQPLPPVPRN